MRKYLLLCKYIDEKINKSVEFMENYGVKVGYQIAIITLLAVIFGFLIQPYVSLKAIGSMTIPVSIIGALVALRHYAYFRRTSYPVADKLRQVFLTDMFIYLVTVFFGIGAMIALEQADFWWGYYVRLIAFSLNIWASVRLFIHMVGEDAEG